MGSILITGSRGFIGTAIRKVIRYPYDEVDFVLGTDHKDIKDRTGTLIFLSSWVKPSESVIRPTKYLENNLVALSMIIENNSFDGIIFPSSHAVYDREGNLEPASVYGLTKLAGEKLIKMYCKNHWILRLGNPYGDNDNRSMFYELAQCKLQNKKIPIYSMNGVMRDYFYVDFVADIVNSILEGRIHPGIYNVGTGHGTVVSEFMKEVCERHGIQHEFVESQAGVPDGFVPLTRLLRAERRDLEQDWQTYYLKRRDYVE